MEKFGSLALEVEEWRCVSMALGVPSVMTSGTTEMPVWCADSWDTPHMVCVDPQHSFTDLPLLYAYLASPTQLITLDNHHFAVSAETIV